MAAGDQEGGGGSGQGAAVSCGHHWWTLGSLHPGAGSWEQTVSGPGRQLRLRMVPRSRGAGQLHGKSVKVLVNKVEFCASHKNSHRKFILFVWWFLYKFFELYFQFLVF